jgi:hypothetical protein
MPRASSVLSLPALLALAAAANAAEPPVITNGTPVAQAPKPGDKPPPPAAKAQLPVIINYAAAFTAPADAKAAEGKGPTIINQSPAVAKPAKVPTRVAVAYSYPYTGEYMGSVAYNNWGFSGPAFGGGYAGYVGDPYAAGYGSGAYGYAGYAGYAGYGYSAYGPGVALVPSLIDVRPPRVEVLDTGVRPTVGRLASMPAVREPVFGNVIAVYYR